MSHTRSVLYRILVVSPSLMTTLLSLLLMPIPVAAQTAVSPVRPLPDLTLSQRLLFHGSGHARLATAQESLACDLATSRAMTALTQSIQRSHATHQVTQHELLQTIPTVARQWDAQQRTCRVTIELEVPIPADRFLPRAAHPQVAQLTRSRALSH